MRLTTKLLAVAFIAIPVAIAPAQTLESFLKDSKYPQKIKPSDLGEDMRAYKIAIQGQGGGGSDIFSMMTNPLMMMMGAFGQAASGEGKTPDPEQAAGLAFLDRMGLSWTNGNAIDLYGQSFLVTYSVQVNLAEAMKQKSPPDLSKADLVLTLVNTKTIASITPRLDMTKEEWLKSPAPPEPNPATAKTSTLSNIKQVALVTMMYMADYDDVTPYVQSTKGAFEVLTPYARNKEIFKTHNPNGSKFLLNMAVAGVASSSIDVISETVLFYEDKEWPDGSRVVAFADGSARIVSADEWPRYQASLSLKLPKVGKPLPATLGANWDGG